MQPKYDILAVALAERERDYRAAIGRLEDLLENDATAYADARLLREAAEVVGCCRRLLSACTVDDIHRAFGAPGDFGYETTLGDALSRLYRN